MKRLAHWLSPPSLLLLSCVLALPVAVIAEEEQAAPQGPPPAQVTFLEVNTQDVPVSFEYVGQVAGSRELAVHSRITGIVEQRLFDEGSSVEEGQPLFKLEADTYEAALQQAQAGLEQAKANVEQARSGLQQAKAGVVVARANREAAVAAKASAAAGRSNALAGVANAEASQESATAGISSAKAQLQQAQAEYNRVATLVKQQLLPRDQLDKVTSALEVARASLAARQADVKKAKAAYQQARSVLEQANAAIKQAEVEVTKADAAIEQAQSDVARAETGILQAQAGVSQAEAAVNSAEVNMQYTTVNAPASGQVGRAVKVRGSLVQAVSDSLMTTVVQLDPAYVNFGMPESQHLQLRRDLEQGSLQMPEDGFSVSLTSSDGQSLPQQGSVNFQDYKVDNNTGNIAMRANFANPDEQLTPGQFVRVQLNGAFRPDAIAIPQRAVLDNPRGKFVYVVEQNEDEQAIAEMRPVEVGEWTSDATQQAKNWIIRSGLQAGDKVIVDGTARIFFPGMPIVPSPVGADVDAAAQE